MILTTSSSKLSVRLLFTSIGLAEEIPWNCYAMRFFATFDELKYSWMLISLPKSHIIDNIFALSRIHKYIYIKIYAFLYLSIF